MLTVPDLGGNDVEHHLPKLLELVLETDVLVVPLVEGVGEVLYQGEQLVDSGGRHSGTTREVLLDDVDFLKKNLHPRRLLRRQFGVYKVGPTQGPLSATTVRAGVHRHRRLPIKRLARGSDTVEERQSGSLRRVLPVLQVIFDVVHSYCQVLSRSPGVM